MRVLILDAYFEPEQIAFTHLENDLLTTFVNCGDEIEIICPTPTRGVDKNTAKKYRRIKSEKLFNGRVHINRFLAPHESKNLINRVLRYFWCNLRTYSIGMHAKSIDVVFSNSTPPTQGMIGAKVAKKLSKYYGQKVPFIYSLQDIFPDSLVNAGMTKKGSIIWKIGRLIENYTYKHADKIIVISKGFKHNIMSKGVPKEKIVVVPNWVNSNDVFPVTRKDNVLFDRYDLDPTRFYICYSGNIGYSQNIELLLDAAERIQRIEKRIVFVIFGEGAEKQHFIDETNKRKINNIKVFSFQPYDDIAHVFSLGDADLIISKKNTAGSSVPSKTWGIMAAGRPIIASFDEESELVQLIKDTDSGVFVNPDDLEGFINEVMYLYHNEENRLRLGKNGYEYVKSFLNREQCTEKYRSIFIESFDEIQNTDL